MKVRDYGLTTPSLQHEHLDKWQAFSLVTATPFATTGVKSSRSLSLTATNLSITTAGVVTGVGTSLSKEVMAGDCLVNTVSGSSFTVQSTPTTATSAQVNTVAVALINNAGPWTVRREAELGATAAVQARTIDSLTIKAHGIPIYNDFPAGFYNAYVPFHYGGPNIVTPEDVGTLMVTFGLYPGTYQPSGHINVSRAREFYLEYTSSVISSTTEGTLVVVASAINFLLISDGSAVLRYST
jgi:hypothetical protein